MDGQISGTFADDASLPLNERWHRCRDFLVKMGFHDPARNWLEGVQGKPRDTFQVQYRGEMLELEILPFKQTPFAAFFDSPDPIAAGLPVLELIERIAERYARPTNGQLKARLIIATAFQRAFSYDYWIHFDRTAQSATGFSRSIVIWWICTAGLYRRQKFFTSSVTPLNPSADYGLPANGYLTRKLWINFQLNLRQIS